MQIVVKLFFHGEVRRVTIGDEGGDLTITHLNSTIDAIFPALRGEDYRLLWKDEDGDFITISSNTEFLDAVHHMTCDGSVAKFTVRSVETEGVQRLASPNETGFTPPVCHEGVKCDECGVLPIVGVRYKCSVRHDFDLCAACEAKNSQPFPMIKMNAPKRPLSPFRGPHECGGRGGRGGGRFGRCGRGRFGGWGSGDPVAVHPMYGTSPFADPRENPHGGPVGPDGIPLDGPDGSPLPFGHVPHRHAHGRGPHHGGRGPCGRGFDWREGLRRRMQRGHCAEGTGSEDFFGSASPIAEDPAVHLGVACDECKANPIVGSRYKCTVRENFDLCSACEHARCRSPLETCLYPMLKIDRPEQAPGTFIYIFNKRSVHGGRHVGNHVGGRGHHRGGHLHGRHGGDSVMTAVHRHVSCDHCGTHPISGPRFKCAVRPDFDLCDSCARTVPQPYPMVKIYHPKHRPSTIVYAVPAPAAATVAAASSHEDPAVHDGFECRECKVSPIIGTRFQCTGRDNYHICGACEATRPFQPFPMVKITDHAQRPRHLVFEVFGAKPVASVALSDNAKHSGIRCDECNQSPICGVRYKCAMREDFDLCAACEAAHSQPFPMIKIYDPNHHPSKLVFVVPDAPFIPAVPHVPTAAPAVAVLPKPSLRFVRDQTLPDGTAVLPNQRGLRKVWEVRNDGTHAWPSGSMLVFAGGDLLHRKTPVGEPVPLLKPGEEGLLEVSLTAPEQVGRYVSYYRMQTAEGQNFGQRLWADIVVANADSSRFVASTPPAVAPVPAPAPASSPSPFITGMDEHTKELQKAEDLLRAEENAQNSTTLVDEIVRLNLEEEDEQLLKQVMAEDMGEVEAELEPFSASDCIPAVAEYAPFEDKVESEDGWAVLVADAETDELAEVDEFSPGVDQPASVSVSVLSSHPRSLSESYFSTCADLDMEMEPEDGGVEEFSSAAEEGKECEPSADDTHTGKWDREVQLLTEMGFNDQSITLPLLEEHIAVPASEKSDNSVDAQGFHAILASLLK